MNTTKQSDVQKLTILIVATAFGYALANGIPNIVINYLIEEFQLSGTGQGMVSSVVNAGILLAVLIAPSFQGRVNKLKMLTFSMILITLSLCLQGSARAAALFFAGSLTIGLGFGWLDGYINSIMIDIHPEDSAVPMGLLHGFYGIGSLVFPLAATALLAVIPWRGIYYICAFVMAIIAAVSLIFCSSMKEGTVAEHTKETKTKFSDILAYCKRGNNALLLLIGFAAGCLQTGIGCWLVRYTTLTFDSETLGATALSAMWIASTVNRFVCPRIKIRPLTLVVIGCALSGLSLLVAVAADMTVLFLILIALVGLFSGHLIPMLFIEAARGEDGNTTMTTFVMQIAMSVGRMLIPLLIAGISAQSGVGAGMVLPGVVSLLAAFAGLVILRKEKPETV